MTTYRLWPATVAVSSPKASNNTVGTEFEVSEDQGLYAIWFYSGSGTTSFPTRIAIWDIASGTVVAGTENDSPTWSGAIGSGWVSCAYDGTIVLSSAKKYITSAYNSNSGLWQPRGASYWTTGAGASGISNGPLSAPGESSSSGGQGRLATGSFTFPSADGQGQNYWIDVEVGDLVVVGMPGAVVQPASAPGDLGYSASSLSSAVVRPAGAPGGAVYSVPSLAGEITG
jgi:hypothetical protein